MARAVDLDDVGRRGQAVLPVLDRNEQVFPTGAPGRELRQGARLEARRIGPAKRRVGLDGDEVLNHQAAGKARSEGVSREARRGIGHEHVGVLGVDPRPADQTTEEIDLRVVLRGEGSAVRRRKLRYENDVAAASERRGELEPLLEVLGFTAVPVREDDERVAAAVREHRRIGR